MGMVIRLGLATPLSDAQLFQGFVQWNALDERSGLDLTNLDGAVVSHAGGEPGLVPVATERALDDAAAREHFLIRAFAHRRLAALFSSGADAGEIISFHARQKLLLLAHSPVAYQDLGRKVARIRELSSEEFERIYREGFMTALRKPATVGRHVNVLGHMAGYFRPVLSPAARQELTDMVAAYARGELPRSVPLGLIAARAKEHGLSYLIDQTYLAPYPAALNVRVL